MADDITGNVRAALAPYLAILRDYVAGGIRDDKFDEVYNTRYLADGFMWPAAVLKQLDAVFAVADDFEIDPVLRPQLVDATGPEELRATVTAALAALTALTDQPD